MQKIKTTVKKTIAYLAKKSACPCIGFQPKEPQTVKKLRKF